MNLSSLLHAKTLLFCSILSEGSFLLFLCFATLVLLQKLSSFDEATPPGVLMTESYTITLFAHNVFLALLCSVGNAHLPLRELAL